MTYYTQNEKKKNTHTENLGVIENWYRKIGNISSYTARVLYKFGPARRRESFSWCKNIFCSIENKFST